MTRCCHILLMLLLAVLLLTGLCGCHSAQEQARVAAAGEASVCPCQAGMRGDLNGSGTPDITDAVGILRIIVGLDPANALADCDCDGATGITDAIALLRCLVGLAGWPIACAGEPFDEMVGGDGQTLVWVPGGSFMMGVDQEDEETWLHRVTLDGFWIGQCEVTNDQYAAFLNAAQPANVAPWMLIGAAFCNVELVGGVYQSNAGRGQHPAVAVSWYGAEAYCDYYGYVLPTEAQWEYAAAGPNANVYPWGAEWDAQKCCNADNQGPFGDTFPVGSFPAGASWVCAYDMAGNVWESCADWYDGDYYSESPELNPPGPSNGSEKVLRGGPWDLDDTYYFRCDARNADDADVRDAYDGFRCARVD